MIVRPHYLDELKKYRDVPLVKILAGIRRCGKSTILDMLREDLLANGVRPEQIIERRYTSLDLGDLPAAKDMYQDIKADLNAAGRNYLLLDEVQEIEGWEKAINSLLELGNTDIYVTGSNSKLMSSEISTYLTVALGMYDERTAYQIVEGIYHSVISNDIARRHSITNQELFNRVVRFIIENVGKNFSANSIVKFLKSEGRSLTVETIYNYLEWLEKAFVIYRCQRYDLQGKAVLKTQEKFYLADPALKYCMMGFNPKSIASMLENIVYFELRRRGYDVYVGKNETKEIDFVAVRRDERVYVQVCRELPDASDREIVNLLEIKDHYPKYVVTMDELAGGNVEGVRIVHLADFLLSAQY